jgi:hypothetical protein
VEICDCITYLTGSQHHVRTDSAKWVSGETSNRSDAPAKEESGKEVALKSTGEDKRLKEVVYTEEKTTVDTNTNNGGQKATVKTSNTVRGESLLNDVHKTLELTLATSRVLDVKGKTSTGVVERIEEEENSGTSSSTRGKIAERPPPVAVTLLLKGKHRRVGIAESEVQSFLWEVTDNNRGVTAPEGGDALLGYDTLEALVNAGVGLGEMTQAEQLILYEKVR